MPLEPGLRSLTLSTAHACRPCLQVTCNQGHRDIKASILDGQYPDERADIVNRYFAKQIDQRRDRLLELISPGEITFRKSLLDLPIKPERSLIEKCPVVASTMILEELIRILAGGEMQNPQLKLAL